MLAKGLVGVGYLTPLGTFFVAHSVLMASDTPKCFSLAPDLASGIPGQVKPAPADNPVRVNNLKLTGGVVVATPDTQPEALKRRFDGCLAALQSRVAAPGERVRFVFSFFCNL